MCHPRETAVPVDVDRKALWVVRELGLPAIVRGCPSCRTQRHHPTGKIRVNASGKLLDVWLLIGCDQCGRTSKVPVHERIHVSALNHERLVRFEDNDPAIVRELATDASLARRTPYQLDWADTWELQTDSPFYDVQNPEGATMEVVVRFELPAPIRVLKLLMAGFGLSRSAVWDMVHCDRIRLPVGMHDRVRADFSFFVAPSAGDQISLC
jgi:hypothetical protein